MHLVSYEFEYCIVTFRGSEGLQGTHMDALNQFRSKLMALTPRRGLWTFLANLALCKPHRLVPPNILTFRCPWVLTLWPPMRILEVMQTLFHCQAGESTTLNHLQKASKRRNHLHNGSKYYLNSQFIDTCKYGRLWHWMFLHFRYGRLLKRELVNNLLSGWREHHTESSLES